MKFKNVLAVLFATVLIFYLVFKINPGSFFVKVDKQEEPKEQPIIVVGEGNPGRISLFKPDRGNYIKKSFDSGFKFVWTVRIGDVKNLGYNQIYAGVGDSFFKTPIKCRVVVYDPRKDFSAEVIDEVSDIRCKDLTIGDLENDGKSRLILGTHGQGLIKEYSYENNSWQKRELEKNYLEVFDKETGSDHKVPLGLDPDIVNQSAIHIIKVGDADNDGKNELLAVVSDPLENPKKDHKLFVKLFRVSGSDSKSEIIDTLDEEIPFKATVDIIDIDNDQKNEVIIGASHHLLLLYKFRSGKWEKEIIDQEVGGVEDNMKGLAVVQINAEGPKSIIAATGVPQAAVYKYDLVSGKFEKKTLFNISNALDKYRIFNGIGDNSLDLKVYDLDNDGRKEIIVAGLQDSSALADKFGATKFGFEATSLGFEVILEQKDTGWNANFIDFRAALSLDVGNLEFYTTCK